MPDPPIMAEIMPVDGTCKRAQNGGSVRFAQSSINHEQMYHVTGFRWLIWRTSGWTRLPGCRCTISALLKSSA